MKAILDEVNELVSDYHLELIITKARAVPDKCYRNRPPKSDWVVLIEDTCLIIDGWEHGYII